MRLLSRRDGTLPDRGPMSQLTAILADIERGDGRAAGRLLPLVYEELRKLATQRMAHERPGQTLQPTALVHEAYVRLVQGADGQHQSWNGRGHFFAAAAEAMRRILIERARRGRRLRHGGGRLRFDLADLDPAQFGADPASDDAATDRLLALNDALDRLEAEDPAAAAVVKLRYFAGLTAQQAADAQGISLRTANRHWAYAKSWLFAQLRDDTAAP